MNRKKRIALVNHPDCTTTKCLNLNNVETSKQMIVNSGISNEKRKRCHQKPIDNSNENGINLVQGNTKMNYRVK